MVKYMKKSEQKRCIIGLLGGSFNPVHLGHLHVAKEARNILGLKRIVLIPAKLQPLKAKSELLDAELRVSLLRNAAKPYQFIDISEIELQRPGKSFTILTLRALAAKKNSATRYCFLLGVDAFMQIKKWRDYKKLFTLVDFSIHTRAGYRYAPAKINKLIKSLGFKPNYEKINSPKILSSWINTHGYTLKVISIPPYPVSATLVRKKLLAGETVAGLLPNNIISQLRDFLQKEKNKSQASAL